MRVVLTEIAGLAVLVAGLFLAAGLGVALIAAGVLTVLMCERTAR